MRQIAANGVAMVLVVKYELCGGLCCPNAPMSPEVPSISAEKHKQKLPPRVGPCWLWPQSRTPFVTMLSLVMSSYSIAMCNTFINWARAPLAAALPFVKVFDAVCINTEIFD